GSRSALGNGWHNLVSVVVPDRTLGPSIAVRDVHSGERSSRWTSATGVRRTTDAIVIGRVCRQGQGIAVGPDDDAASRSVAARRSSRQHPITETVGRSYFDAC